MPCFVLKSLISLPHEIMKDNLEEIPMKKRTYYKFGIVLVTILILAIDYAVSVNRTSRC